MRRYGSLVSLVLAFSTPMAIPSAFSQDATQQAPSEPGTDASQALPETPTPVPPRDTAAVAPADLHHAVADPAPPAFALSELRELLPQTQEGAEASSQTKAVSEIYGSRRDEPIWVTPTGLNEKGASALAELRQADDWGLDSADYVLPSLPAAATNTAELPRSELADAEIKLSLAVLAYAHDARGGRIMDPSKQLSSYLDRVPQLIEPRILLEEMSEAADPGMMLRKLHPQHPQFEKLRQKYVAMRTTAASARQIVRMPSSGHKL